MKITNLLKFLIPALVVIGLSSCCHEIDCTSGAINVIGFVGFTTSHQLDSVTIRRYPIGSTYLPGQEIGEFKITKYGSVSNITSNHDTTSITIGNTAPFTISPGFKYQIFVPALGSLDSVTSNVDSVADAQTQVQACSGTEYTSKGCLNPLQFILQDSVAVGGRTSYEVIYVTYH